MILKMFSVYDSKANAFMQPFFEMSRGTALRAVNGVLQKPDHVFAKYPADFTLFELGEYDDSCGEFLLPKNGKVALGTLLELRSSGTTSQAPDNSLSGAPARLAL